MINYNYCVESQSLHRDKNRVNSSNFNATILKFLEKFNHRFLHVFIIGYFFLRVTVSLLCRLQAVSVTHVIICPYLQLIKRDEIVRPCDRQSYETVTLRKHGTKYKKTC